MRAGIYDRNEITLRLKVKIARMAQRSIEVVTLVTRIADPVTASSSWNS